jgi:hypothetical protein
VVKSSSEQIRHDDDDADDSSYEMVMNFISGESQEVTAEVAIALALLIKM